MPDVPVALRAPEWFRVMQADPLTRRSRIRKHRMIHKSRHPLMTIPARALHHGMIRFRDPDWVRKITGCEIKGMPKSILRFHVPFAEEIMRCMAVVTARRKSMARL